MKAQASYMEIPRGVPVAVQTPTGPITCRLDGNPDGPAILFSNSHATNYALWDRQVAALEDRYNIVRYDQRGHGATPIQAGTCTFDSLAFDIEHILDHLALPFATLVGVSMGAVTVMRCAALISHRVSRVVACDGQWASPPGARDMWQRRIDKALSEGTRAIVDETLKRWFTSESTAVASESVATARAMIEATSAEGYAQCARAMQDYDFRADYAALEIPVLFVVGEHDGKLPAVMREMGRATKSSSLVEVANCGHLPNLERHHAFNDVIKHFLDNTECERASGSNI